jgi:prepilin-type N-terminal cleavage/methylation domain-containing protein
MKTEFKAKFLQHLISKKDNKGFTLIELLVVVIIIGVLAAVALPNLLAQVGKARESEGKNAVGTVNRGQQQHHFEKQFFATDSLTLGVTLPVQYYETYAIASGGSAQRGDDATAHIMTKNAEAVADGTRAFGGAIDFTKATGEYKQIICQSDSVVTQITMTDATTGCPGASTELK